MQQINEVNALASIATRNLGIVNEVLQGARADVSLREAVSRLGAAIRQLQLTVDVGISTMPMPQSPLQLPSGYAQGRSAFGAELTRLRLGLGLSQTDAGAKLRPDLARGVAINYLRKFASGEIRSQNFNISQLAAAWALSPSEAAGLTLIQDLEKKGHDTLTASSRCPAEMARIVTPYLPFARSVLLVLPDDAVHPEANRESGDTALSTLVRSFHQVPQFSFRVLVTNSLGGLLLQRLPWSSLLTDGGGNRPPVSHIVSSPISGAWILVDHLVALTEVGGTILAVFDPFAVHKLIQSVQSTVGKAGD